jgi:hypothetical protein
MSSKNIAVTYSGTQAAEIGIVVDTSGNLTVGIGAGFPNEVNKLLEILDAARQVIINNYARSSNPGIPIIAMRNATGF